MTDNRSELAVKIMNANPNAYQSLVVEGGTPAFAIQQLKDVKSQQLLSTPAASSDAAEIVLAGLWLWHDGLNECHSIVQKSNDPTGAFWHAIMHRREGDFSNSKYWYARAAGHSVLATLAAQAGSVVNDLPADRLLLRVIASGFDPNALVDLIEEVNQNPDDSRRAATIKLQRLEWRLLFDHCTSL